jgi:hypothetical protein
MRNSLGELITLVLPAVADKPVDVGISCDGSATLSRQSLTSARSLSLHLAALTLGEADKSSIASKSETCRASRVARANRYRPV